MRRALSRLTALHWSWIHAKAALGVWAILLLLFTPTKVETALGAALVWIVSGITLSGVVISVTGLILSAPERGSNTPTRATLRGLTVELFGLWWMWFGGLVMYTGVQFALIFGPEGDQRIALTSFSYAFAAFVLCRIAMVIHRRRKETTYLRVRTQ